MWIILVLVALLCLPLDAAANPRPKTPVVIIPDTGPPIVCTSVGSVIVCN